MSNTPECTRSPRHHAGYYLGFVFEIEEQERDGHLVLQSIPTKPID